MTTTFTPRARGIALVVVLTFLVLISALVIALITTADTEAISARSYQSSVTVKQLDASAVGLVLGQLADGTRSVKVPGQTTGRLAWASQPGMIRTWDDTGAPWKFFKLYSARDMVVVPNSDGLYSVSKTLPTEVPDDWPSRPAHFTDLNEPVVVEDTAGPILRGTKHFRASYPIVDPLAAADGFSISNPPGFGAGIPSATLDPAQPAAQGRTGNPAPMPVRWIYVLRDGTFTVPDDASNAAGVANWPAGGATSPSRENPIVGRIAFWTDDETCKLNLNTASEPTPWDTPRAITIQDLRYGQFQPAQKEYQRFPGHPLTTALSPVFFPGVKLTAAQKEDIYKLLPRVQPGGTVGATVATTAPIIPDEDRLYANVDEFLFRPEMPGVTRVDNTVFSAEKLRRSRFFLTANSRAPELNLFGQPRVSLWPVNSSPSLRTAYDKLAVFCSTIGSASSGTTRPFYFQRGDAASPTADYQNIARNKALFTYLQRMTGSAVPGYGGNFATKWGQDRDQILTEIFDYIRCVNLHDPLPSATQFAGDNNPGADTAGEGQVTPIQIGENNGFGRFFTVSQAGMHFICSQEADAGILKNNVTPVDQLGSSERLVNTSFLFEPWSPALGFYPIYESLYFDVQFPADGFSLNGIPMLMRAGGKALSKTIGSGWHNNGREHGGAGGLRGPMQAFGGGSYQWISQATTTLVDAKTKVPGVKVTGDTMSFVGGEVTIRIFAGTTADTNKLVQTLKIQIPNGTFPVPQLVRTGTDAYRGGGATAVGNWWTFGSYTNVGKVTVGGRYSSLGSVPHAPGPEYADPKRRWVDSDGPPGFKIGGIFRDEDVVRTVVPNHGDIRLIAAKRNVPASDFVKVREKEWNSITDRLLHVFTSPAGSHFLYGFGNEPGDRPGGPNRANPLGGTLGGIPGADPTDQLVASAAVKYHFSRLPEIRPGAGKEFNRWNDYDNGVSTWSDGSYINKPDEGNYNSTNSPYTYFSWNTAADSTGNFFSPNRLVPSAGMFGSLPTGVKSGRPWETLLFRPEVRKDGANKPHPGTQSPRDHLLMDLFWMPVIEPYAISEPFSTSGKVNLNYEIAPFSYIRRATGLYGVLKAEEPLILPNSAAQIYKLWDHETNDHPYKLPNDPSNPVQDSTVKSDWDKAYRGLAPFNTMRRPIDPGKTLQQADDRFTLGAAFRSATEVCELHLVREGETLAEYTSGSIWQNALITGDNTRERPYTNLYARLTTRSNTFTVHVRAQVLRQSGGANGQEWNVWREDRTPPLAEYRGSTLVERYIDPADPNLVDFATQADAVSDRAWRVRIVAARKFVP